ncbi:GDP-mannose mannosyl hydrolase [Desulforhopalus sp. 52FAK]
MLLDKNQFLQVVKCTPLVSIDLIVRSPEGAVLMGLRMNQPAAGYWFVPGGIICKGETLDTAFLRITKAELGEPIGIDNGRLMGAFTHLYNTNFAMEPGVGTHYVVLAYELQTSIELRDLPGEQHSNYRWIHEDDELENVHKNSVVYFSYLTKLS